MSNMLPKDSDLIERYVLGLTTSDENAHVETLRKESTEIEHEISELQQSLEYVATRYERRPPPTLQASIWNAIQGASTPPTFEQKAQASPRASAISGSGRPATLFTHSTLLFSLIAIGTTLFGGYFMFKASESDRILRESQKEILELQAHIQRSDNDQRSIQHELDFRNSPSTLAIPLLDRNEDNTVIARVYCNPTDTVRYLLFSAVSNAQSPGSMTLWAFADGVFTRIHSISSSEIGKMIAVHANPPSREFVVTRDNGTSKSQPELSNIIAYSSKKLLLSQPRKSRRNPFIAGEPYKPMKRP